MKPKTTPDQAVPPKRRISRWEKEWKRRRIIAIIAAVVIIAAGGLIGTGIYVKKIKPWHQAIVKVNGQVFDTDYFVKMLRTEIALSNVQYQLYYGRELYDYEKEQMATSLIYQIQRDELIRQKAEELEVDDISNQEIEGKIENLFGFDPAGEETIEEFLQQIKSNLKEIGTSLEDYTKFFIKPALLQEKVMEAMGNDEYPKDSTYDQVRVKAILLGTKEEAQEVIGNWGGDFNHIIKDFSPSQYYPQGGYWLVMVYEPTDAEEHEEEGLYIKTMLLATKDKADELKDEIVNSGADFATLAEENSLDTSAASGGDLGWMSLDSIESKFGDLEAIQDLGPNTISAPISQNYPDGPVEWLPADIESSAFDEYVFKEGSETSGLSIPIIDTAYTTKGGYWLVMIYEPVDAEEQEEEGLYIKAILLDSKAEADNLKADIEAGGDFATLAEEKSLDSSKGDGGDLGWMSLDDIKSQFGETNYDEYIKDLVPNKVSESIYDEDVSKQSGYWVIEVLDREYRTLTEEHRDLYISEYYNNWFDGEFQNGKTEGRIKDYLDDDKLSWALDHL